MTGEIQFFRFTSEELFIRSTFKFYNMPQMLSLSYKRYIQNVHLSLDFDLNPKLKCAKKKYINKCQQSGEYKITEKSASNCKWHWKLHPSSTPTRVPPSSSSNSFHSRNGGADLCFAGGCIGASLTFCRHHISWRGFWGICSDIADRLSSRYYAQCQAGDTIFNWHSHDNTKGLKEWKEWVIWCDEVTDFSA